VFSL
jgi:hypothetical protein